MARWFALEEPAALKRGRSIRGVECRWLGWCRQEFLGVAILTLVVAPASALGFEIRQAGKLQVSPKAQLFAFSTDPIIQEVLSQDFQAASRSSIVGAASTVTVSVNVTQQVLRPGISLAQIAPGDPQVADLIKAAGANPPPLGDTGTEYDQAALARRLAARDYMPENTISDRLINSSAGPEPYFPGIGPPIPLPCSAQTVARPGCPPVPQSTVSATTTPGRSVGDIDQYLARRSHDRNWFGVPDSNDYDTIIVARASATGSAEEMTLVAVAHPGEDIVMTKKNIAERIASSVLN